MSPPGRPTTRAAAGRPPALDLRLLGHLQRVVNLDPEVPHGALQLGMPKQQLNRAKVLRATVDQGSLGAAQGVGPVS